MIGLQEILREARTKGLTHEEVFWILEELTQKPFYKLLMDEKGVPEVLYKKLKRIFEERSKGIPLSYLGFSVRFLDLILMVPEGVFIPRPETEALVERVFSLFSDTDFPFSFVDVGVGSGAIMLSILKRYKKSIGYGIDTSEKALRVTLENARLNGIEDLNLIKGDSLTPFGKRVFDLVVSNPPYVSNEEYEELSLLVKREPKEAIVSSDNGLYLLKKIITESTLVLNKRGYLVVECSPHQAEFLKGYAIDMGFKADIYYDLDGRMRGIEARLVE